MALVITASISILLEGGYISAIKPYRVLDED